MKQVDLVQDNNGEWTDPETGELFQTIAFPSPNKLKERNWFMSFQNGFIKLATDKDLTGETFRVLNFCLGMMDFENYIRVSQREIAETLGMKQPSVSRALKLLVDKGVLIKEEKSGRHYSYRLNTDYGWRGRVANLRKRRKKETEELPAALHNAEAS